MISGIFVKVEMTTSEYLQIELLGKEETVFIATCFNADLLDRACRGITRIHRSPSRPRPSMRPIAAFINIHEHLI